MAAGRAAPGGAPNPPWSGPRPGISTLHPPPVQRRELLITWSQSQHTTQMPRYAAQGLLDLEQFGCKAHT